MAEADQLSRFVEENLKAKLDAGDTMVHYDEAATKQGVILPILHHLGWNTYDVNEVHPEYDLDGKKIDYSLRIGESSRVFIEAKRIQAELESHEEQLLNYAFKEGVRLSILTNGLTWWFYLSLEEGSWEERKFYTIHIPQQDTQDVVSNFVKFLQRDNVQSGQALRNAEEVYRSRTRLNVLRKTIPQVWSRIVGEPHEFLMDLIAEETEEACGYKPDEKTIKGFLAANKSRFSVGEEDVTTKGSGTATGRKPKETIAKKPIEVLDTKEKPKASPVDFQDACIRRLGTHLNQRLIRQSKPRVLYVSARGATRLICLISREKRVEEKRTSDVHISYWFGFRPNQRAVLEASPKAYLALGCGSDEKLLLIPYIEF